MPISNSKNNLAQTSLKEHFPQATPKDIANYLESLRWIEQTLFQWASIVESSEDAILGKDLDGTLTSWNRAAERMYGYGAEEIIGKSVLTIFPPGQKKELQNILAQIKKGKQVKHYETKRVRKDGRTIDVSVTVSPIKDIAGRIIGASVIARDITEQKRANYERFSLASIVDSSDEAIISHTLDGILTSWNKGARRLYGYSAKEVIGQSSSLLFTTKQKSAASQLLKKTDGKNGIAEYETAMVHKNGKVLHVSVKPSHVYDDKGKLIGFSLIIRDISHRLEKERLTELELTAKDEFISLVSHQIRTPATAARQFIGMLLEGYAGTLNPNQLSLLQKAYESNIRQLTVVDELLRVAKAEAGKVVLKKEKFNLAELVESILLEQKYDFAQRNQTVSFRSTPKSFPVKADRNNLRMVLENIIDNARKYTPDNKAIAVTLSRTKSTINIAVKDEGVGISKRNVDKIFERFSRVNNALSEKTEGSGLGLYWAEKIVRMHGGKIEVSSEVNRGSVFTVKIPV